MKTAYFDCMFGVSGDMILGALVACGVPIKYLIEELGKLGVNGFELRKKDVTRAGIAAVHIDVIIEHQQEHRHLSHIKEIICSSSISDSAKDRAVRIFTHLAEAEAKVHGTSREKVHFHEVGALDAIVDVTGACIGIEYLGIDRVISTPLHFGTGTVECAHGVMPVPVPAVVELTKDVPVVRTSREGEITTPTGAAIITTIASSYGTLENFTPAVIGYGAGTKVMEDYPNILRISVGEESASFETDKCQLLETNIDDMNPEIFGYLSGRLFEAGAKDVYMIPIYMKKGRPGTLLSVLADNSTTSNLIEMILSETTSLGVRVTNVERKKLEREIRAIDTEFGSVHVKVAIVGGHERYAPEFDDCARIAREKGIPFLTVYEAVKKSIPIPSGM
jgi:pyridinium-3,5-bisthiocarboxylic acid mononucleotide nickel chelatase